MKTLCSFRANEIEVLEVRLLECEIDLYHFQTNFILMKKHFQMNANRFHINSKHFHMKTNRFHCFAKHFHMSAKRFHCYAKHFHMNANRFHCSEFVFIR